MDSSEQDSETIEHRFFPETTDIPKLTESDALELDEDINLDDMERAID